MPDLSTTDATTLAGTELVNGTTYYMSLHTADPSTTTVRTLHLGAVALVLAAVRSAAPSYGW